MDDHHHTPEIDKKHSAAQAWTSVFVQMYIGRYKEIHFFSMYM